MTIKTFLQMIYDINSTHKFTCGEVSTCDTLYKFFDVGGIEEKLIKLQSSLVGNKQIRIGYILYDKHRNACILNTIIYEYINTEYVLDETSIHSVLEWEFIRPNIYVLKYTNKKKNLGKMFTELLPIMYKIT